MIHHDYDLFYDTYKVINEYLLKGKLTTCD